MAAEELGNQVLCEAAIGWGRRDFRPPIRRSRPLVEMNASELTGISKHQRNGFQRNDQMIVFGRAKWELLGTQLSGHAEVNSDPSLAAEAKQHLLTACE